MIAQGIDKDCQDHRRFGSGHHGLHNHASHHDYSTDLIDLLRRKGIETGSISKACFENGFHGLSYFAQVFKRKTGYTPSQYLKEHKKVLQNQPSAGSSQPLFKREHNVQIDTDPNLPQRNPFTHVSAFGACDIE